MTPDLPLLLRSFLESVREMALAIWRMPTWVYLVMTLLVAVTIFAAVAGR